MLCVPQPGSDPEPSLPGPSPISCVCLDKVFTLQKGESFPLPTLLRAEEEGLSFRSVSVQHSAQGPSSADESQEKLAVLLFFFFFTPKCRAQGGDSWGPDSNIWHCPSQKWTPMFEAKARLDQEAKGAAVQPWQLPLSHKKPLFMEHLQPTAGPRHQLS